MKMFKIWSLAALLLLTMVACGDKNKEGNKGSNSFDDIAKEWKLISVNGVEPEFTVYVSFDGGIFNMFQQVYDLEYLHYEGDYTINGNVISGSYSDGTAWKCSYTGGVSSDGNQLTLTSKESNPITCVYTACVIPDDVREGALSTRSVEVVPFL